MVRIYREVPKRAKRSIEIHLKNLIKKYGEREVRLVTMNFLRKISDRRRIEQTIKEKEEELKQLKIKK